MRYGLVVFAAIVAACGGGDRAAVMDSAGGSVEGAPVTGSFVVAVTEWRVDLPMDTLPAGRYTFRVENSGTTTHALEIEGNGREWTTGDLAPGSASELTVDLEPGTYEVYCPVESGEVKHDERGMQRRLVVRAA